MLALRNFFAYHRQRIAIAAVLVTVVLVAGWFFVLRDDPGTSSSSPPVADGAVTVIYDEAGNIVSVGNVAEIDPAAALRALGIPQTCDEGLARLEEIIAEGDTALTADPDKVYAFNTIHYVSTELCSFRRLQDWSATNMTVWTDDNAAGSNTSDGEAPNSSDQGTVIDVSGDERPLPGATPNTVMVDATPAD